MVRDEERSQFGRTDSLLPKGQVLAVVGMAGAGKSTVSGWFRTKGAEVVRLGDVVVIEVQRRGLDITPENEKLVREDLRTKQGPLVIAEYALEQITDKVADDHFVVVDGLYSLSEYLLFQRVLHGRILVAAIHASPALRYARLQRRSERPLTAEQAVARDLAELRNLEKGGPIALADTVLHNQSTSEALASQCERLLEEWVTRIAAATVADGLNLWETAAPSRGA